MVGYFRVTSVVEKWEESVVPHFVNEDAGCKVMLVEEEANVQPYFW
jgi:hypothetical protein